MGRIQYIRYTLFYSFVQLARICPCVSELFSVHVVHSQPTVANLSSSTVWVYLLYIGKSDRKDWSSASGSVIVCWWMAAARLMCFHARTNWNISKRINVQTRWLWHKLCLSTMQQWWQTGYLPLYIWELRWSRMGEWRTTRWELFQTIVGEVLILLAPKMVSKQDLIGKTITKYEYVVFFFCRREVVFIKHCIGKW